MRCMCLCGTRPTGLELSTKKNVRNVLQVSCTDAAQRLLDGKF